ncbi:MAG TPA: YbaB/EbfC family nucleoid-associated protein [Chitinophagales bacterium]|nr:YbaB/EbfC family nucleoid-associated protein [Chitinophagales bacterium]HMU70206.1 YbaB/EbfC family nucleoid-associated protein [Chitinophagales bacterium]HMX03846.1 YbaB/EbfC family nucleoid-associated protein [Chitinophagales bacterium]HMZ89446.1 YbaB/EbfC family nucleoid-associated protein [Chitinophagales bacterium]HNA58704.1 YbaB/EbfC family nucleoid-associated protein [Chitinophagales bacterium]
MFDIKKAMEMKKQMEEIQKRLDNITVEGVSGDGKFQVVVTITANKKVKSVHISDELMASGDKEHLEDLLVIAMERGLDKATQVSEAEARNVALSGGLNGLFGS